MLYKKEIIEEFTLFAGTDIEYVHVFKNGILETSTIKFVPQNISTTFHLPEYSFLQEMLKTQNDLKKEMKS